MALPVLLGVLATATILRHCPPSTDDEHLKSSLQVTHSIRVLRSYID
jgi:hypothetical protein